MGNNKKCIVLNLFLFYSHEGPVWQVAWAHPKFGSILASCSYDGSVIIWQEDKQKSPQASAAGTHSTWSKIKIHRAHESSVNSICFAPHAYGLHLACASSDGKVSILSKTESEEWKVQMISAHNSGCNSVAWCPSAVPSSLLALDFNALDKKPLPCGPKMIATGGCDNTVKIWRESELENDDGVKEEKWQLESTLNDHTDWVRDVCWRPSMGQTGRMLVSCSQDNTVLIWKQEGNEWKSKPLKQQPFPDTLWRVSFSEYGHLLAVSCGDNTVTLWRENAEDGSWILVGNVDENVTETVKIDEPLAVVPPPAAPIPEINFASTGNQVVNDAGYMKAMSPMIPLSNLHLNPTTGYSQYDQAYDSYQNAQTPTVPSVDVYNKHEMLAAAVIPDTPAYIEPIEFNKDIGFTGGYESQAYEAQGYEPQQPETQAYEAQTYEAQSYEPQGYEQYESQQYESQTYETQQYEAQGYEPQQYEAQAYETQGYEAQGYESQNPEIQQYETQQTDTQQYEPQTSNEEQAQATTYESYDAYQPQEDAQQPLHESGDFEQEQVQQSYAHSQYEQTLVNDQSAYNDQAAYNTYEQASYDQSAYDQTAYDQTAYDQSTYEQPAQYQYTDYQPADQSNPPQQQEVDYTLQYEGYQPQSYTDF